MIFVVKTCLIAYRGAGFLYFQIQSHFDSLEILAGLYPSIIKTNNFQIVSTSNSYHVSSHVTQMFSEVD